MHKHNPDFIAEMKQNLEQERKRLQHDLQSIAKKVGSDYKATFPEYGRNDEDNASEVGDYTATLATEQALETRLEEIEEALKRINNGTYGITNKGEIIPPERLRANPAATTIVAPT